MLNKPLKIADMGCGCGNSTLAMASIFPQANVHGLDIDKDSIIKAKANINHPNVTFTGKYLYFTHNIRYVERTAGFQRSLGGKTSCRFDNSDI